MKTRFRVLVGVCVWLVALLVATLAAGAGDSPTSAPGAKAPTFPADSYMAKIQQRGKLIAGVKLEVPMFGYLNPKTNKMEGFEIDLAREIARKIFGDVADIDQKIEYKDASGRSRVPMVQEGVVDAVLSMVSITDERKQQIDFSDLYWMSGQGVLVQKDSPIKGLKDLNGKTVATTKGTTTEQMLRNKFPGAKLLLFDTNADALAAVQNKRADALVSDQGVLLGFLAIEPSMTMIRETLMEDPWGIGIQKGHPEFVAFIDGVLKDLKSSGKWKEVYKKNIIVGGAVPEPPK